MYPNMPYIRPFYCQLKVYFPGAPPSPPMRQSLSSDGKYLPTGGVIKDFLY